MAKRTTARSRLDEMVADLRSDISSGKRAEGEFLPSELDLGELYSISKNTVRKGLDQLVADGFIEKVPRIGARVLRKKQETGERLRFGYYSSLDAETELLKLVERFNEAQSDIQVEPIPVGYPRNRESMAQYLNEGMYFDVMTINLYNFDFASADSPDKSALEPFDVRDDLYPFLNAPFTSGGRQYALPFVFTPVILYYNKEHFREVGLSEPNSGWTWDNLSEAADKLAAGKERLGFYFHLMSENRWPIFLLQNGVRFERKADGRYDLCNPLVKESLETCMGIVDKHFPSHLSENDGDVVSLFLRGKVSMVMASYSHLHAMKEAPFEYDIAPLPHLREVKTILVSIGLAVNKSSTRKAAAKRFVDYLLSYETQLHIRRHTLNLPSLRKAAEWVDAEGDTHTPYRFHMYRELIHTFRTYADLNLTALELTAIRDEMRFYWSKLDDLDTVLKRLEEKL